MLSSYLERHNGANVGIVRSDLLNSESTKRYEITLRLRTAVYCRIVGNNPVS